MVSCHGRRRVEWRRVSYQLRPVEPLHRQLQRSLQGQSTFQWHVAEVVRRRRGICRRCNLRRGSRRTASGLGGKACCHRRRGGGGADDDPVGVRHRGRAHLPRVAGPAANVGRRSREVETVRGAGAAEADERRVERARRLLRGVEGSQPYPVAAVGQADLGYPPPQPATAHAPVPRSRANQPRTNQHVRALIEQVMSNGCTVPVQKPLCVADSYSY